MDKILITGFNGFLTYLVWIYFSYHMLHSKYKGCQGEAIIFSFWMIWLVLTATILYNAFQFKLIMLIITTALPIIFVYKDPLYKKVGVSIFLIGLEILSELVVLTLINPSAAYHPVLFIIIGIFTTSIQVFVTNKIIDYTQHRIHPLQKEIQLVTLLLFVQLNMEIVFVLTLVNKHHAYLYLECIYLIILNAIFFIYYQKTCRSLLNLYKEEMLHEELTALYKQQLDTVLMMKSKENITRQIRHDLLNELMLIQTFKRKA